VGAYNVRAIRDASPTDAAPPTNGALAAAERTAPADG
jgi:hypothetical protein